MALNCGWHPARTDVPFAPMKTARRDKNIITSRSLVSGYFANDSSRHPPDISLVVHPTIYIVARRLLRETYKFAGGSFQFAAERRLDRR